MYCRPGSEYAASEVGSSSYLSVSPPRCDMNNTDYPEPVSPRNFDQQSLASTFSFNSTSSSLLLKSKAQYKDYNYVPPHDGEGGEERQRGEKAFKQVAEESEPTDYTVSPASEDIVETNNQIKDNAVENTEEKLNNNHTEIPEHNTKDKQYSTCTSSSGPSPPSSSPAGSGSNSPPLRVIDADEIRKPAKKRKRLSSNSEDGFMNGDGESKNRLSLENKTSFQVAEVAKS